MTRRRFSGWVRVLFNNLVAFVMCLLILTQSTLAPSNAYENIRAFTRMQEFDYITWTMDALVLKNIQQAVTAPAYMSVADQRKVVFEYMRHVALVNATNFEIEQIYANPDIADPVKEAAKLNEELRVISGEEQALKPIAEAVIQYQVSTTVADLGLTLGGQPFPPVLYHVTRLPNALIISPRDVIRQEYDISLQPEMTTEQKVQIENSVEKKANVSALVEPIGGVGIYPTMVMSTTDLSWLLEIVSHEWTHNFLTLRPLGMLYMSDGQMRTINETTANLSGKEISRAVMERYYPEIVPPEPEEEKVDPNKPAPTPAPVDPNRFNFRREMHETRVQVDEMLAAGKIEEAENYMEQRRRFMWEHGYQIRKLNQAYFAFYGAYNDSPGGGAAGKDPVGPAVQELRAHSKSLADFLNRISWLTSYAGLQNELEKAKSGN